MSTVCLASHDLLVFWTQITKLQPNSFIVVQGLRRSGCLQPAVEHNPSVESSRPTVYNKSYYSSTLRHEWCFPAHIGTDSDKIHSLMKPVIKCVPVCVCVCVPPLLPKLIPLTSSVLMICIFILIRLQIKQPFKGVICILALGHICPACLPLHAWQRGPLRTSLCLRWSLFLCGITLLINKTPTLLINVSAMAAICLRESHCEQ